MFNYTEDMADILLELNGKGKSDENGVSEITFQFELKNREALSRFKLNIVPNNNSSEIIEFGIEITSCIFREYFEISPHTEKSFFFSGGEGKILSEGNYTAKLKLKNLRPNEEYDVELKIMKDFSSLPSISKAALLEAQAQGMENCICFTISDHFLNSITHRNMSHFYIEKELSNGMCMKLTFPEKDPWYEGKVSYLFKIHGDEKIDFKINLELSLFKDRATMEEGKHPFACIGIPFILELVPHITKGTDEYLELKMSNVKIQMKPDVEIPIMEQLQVYFPNMASFEAFILLTIEEMSSGDEKKLFGDTFLIILDRIALPSNWGTMGKTKAYFEKFYYRNGYINGQSSGFLVAVFSVYTLVSCSEIKTANLYDNPLSSIQSFSECESQFLSSRLGIGISQSALNEIIKPFRSYVVENSYSGGGDLSWEVSHWVRSGIDKVKITETGLDVQIPGIEGGGKLSARYKVRGIKLWRASASIKIDFEDVDLALSIGIEKKDSFIGVVLGAKIDIGDIDVEVEVHNKHIIDLGEKIEVDFPKDGIISMINLALALTLFNNWEAIPDAPIYPRGVENNWHKDECVIVQLEIGID
ncbi:hypothetical protein BKK40_08760 [Bacillus cereus]|nr:hypothetical protein BKK40_08760 [Bacillus cereus]